MKKYTLFLMIIMLATVLMAGCITITPQQPEKPPEPPPAVKDTPAKTAPSIVSFEISSGEIASGESATLTWQVTGADTVTVTPDVGNVPQSGSVEVSPTVGTIYILTATNKIGTSTRSVGINIKGSMTPQSIALSEADLGAYGFVFVSDSVPNDVPGAVATYSIKFRRGDEELINNVATFPSSNSSLSYYFHTKEPYRTADAWPIYSINDQMAYVIINKGSPEIPNSDKYNIRLTKSNVYAEVGYINNYSQLQDFARLIETRIQ